MELDFASPWWHSTRLQFWLWALGQYHLVASLPWDRERRQFPAVTLVPGGGASEELQADLEWALWRAFERQGEDDPGLPYAELDHPRYGRWLVALSHAQKTKPKAAAKVEEVTP